MAKRRWSYVVGLLLLMSATQVNCMAQQKNVVKKTYAFYTEKLPGILPVNPNGEKIIIRPDTTIVVYVETSTKLIKWDTAWFNGHCFSIYTQAVTQDKIEVGIKKDSSLKTVLMPAKNNFIWQLYLQPIDENKNTLQKNKRIILLKGQCKGKIFYQKIAYPVQLEGIPSV